jgi:hypothetical protein
VGTVAWVGIHLQQKRVASWPCQVTMLVLGSWPTRGVLDVSKADESNVKVQRCKGDRCTRWLHLRVLCSAADLRRYAHS